MGKSKVILTTCALFVDLKMQHKLSIPLWMWPMSIKLIVIRFRDIDFNGNGRIEPFEFDRDLTEDVVKKIGN